MKPVLQIDIGDVFTFSFAAIKLNTLMNDEKLKIDELTRWFSSYESLYNRYVQKAEQLGVKIENVVFHNPYNLFINAYIHKDETIAKYYANHFNKHGNNYIHELEHLETSLSDKKSFDEWVTKMKPVIKASEHLTEYAASHTDIDETIANAAKSSEQISEKYKEVYNRLERRILESDIREKAEKILEMIPYLKIDMPNIIKKSVNTSDISVFDNWKNSYTEFFEDIQAAIDFAHKFNIDNTDRIFLAQNVAENFCSELSLARETALQKINEYLQFKEYVRKTIQPVEGRMLDDQQLDSIVNDDDNQLIIAGAGTGKTTTIIGKVKYLLKTNKCRHEDILLLSFTNKSASEMKERVKAETGFDMDVMTFHKLGLEILAKADNKRPTIYSTAIQDFTRKTIKSHLADARFTADLISYLLLSPAKYKTQFDFDSVNEYKEYINDNPPITLKQERVKGYCEMEIANFLYTNNIRYTYEKVYEIDTADEEYSGYHPDFYLDDYGIYIEFFAVDKNGNVPEFFSANHGGTGQSEYLSGIEWKRKTHKENNTTLIELFYADKQDNKLTERLTEKLKENNVQLTPMPEDALLKEISGNNANVISSVCDIIGTVITLAKSKGYDVQKLCEVGGPFNASLLRITIPIFEDYSRMLAESGQIDFNDMILNAADYVREGRYEHSYKYVIVDEYQDISMARYTLLNELRKKSFYKLFCVGDDWQSIYRFAGSDISYILNFEYYWGKASISKIETTYRFSSQLIEISGYFVMQNPNQVRKALKSSSSDTAFPLGLIKAYNDKYLIQFMEEKMHSLPRNATVFFIGRYSFDKDMLKDSNFHLSYNNVTGSYEVDYPPRPDLKIEFITAHKSKGLQADYVFILNNKNKGMGFPSKIQDDPLIQVLLNGCDNYPYAEERRLFYVALTRAKKKLWLLVQQDNESEFAKELIGRYGDAMRQSEWTCPLCGGRLVKRNGKNGEFIGCSNFSKIGCKYTRNIAHKGNYEKEGM